jgi:hypothetical protein
MYSIRNFFALMGLGLLLTIASYLAMLPTAEAIAAPTSTATVTLTITKAISGVDLGYELSDFSYRVTGPGVDAVVPHANSIDLPIGEYTIEELVPAGFVKTDWRIGWYGACDAGSAYSTTITIDDGNVDHGWLDCQADNQYRPVNQPEIEGCTDPEADNYDPAADVDDGSCTTGTGGGDETYLITGFVWHDVNEDGVIDDDEDRLENWEVQLTSDDTLATTSTDGDGYYEFVVTAGTYTLAEVIEEDWQQVYPTPTTYTITVPEDIAYAAVPFPLSLVVAVAHAQTSIVGGPFNFGNVFVGGNNGGGGNGFTCSLSASASSVASGSSVVLTWDATGSLNTEINNGVGSTTAVGTTSVAVSSDTTYTLIADNGQATTSCSASVTVSSGGGSNGGGGGSSRPVCEAFILSDTNFVSGATSTLSWETRRGRELSITANGVEIFATTTDAVVDAGTTTVVATERTTYELTVTRGSRTDTCSVGHSNPSRSGGSRGSGGGSPEVLGEQVSTVPVGAPNTGFGGAASTVPQWLALGSFLLLVTGFWLVRRRS